MASQCDRILQYMKDFGSITAVEAMETFGCQRLAARVSDLRSKGYPVVAHLETGKNRYGEPVSFARYSLEVNADE